LKIPKLLDSIILQRICRSIESSNWGLFELDWIQPDTPSEIGWNHLVPSALTIVPYLKNPQDTAAEMSKGYMDEETQWMLFDMLKNRNEWWERGFGLVGLALVSVQPTWRNGPDMLIGLPQAVCCSIQHHAGVEKSDPIHLKPNPWHNPPPIHPRWVPGKIVDIRARIAPLVRAPGSSRDLMLLDIALDGYFRWIRLAVGWRSGTGANR
jgi:hypothetical protein